MIIDDFSDFPKPVFQNGSTPDLFQEHPVYAMISILKTHPIIRPNGAKQLVQFLSKLPQPSTILLVDSLNRFNINAFEIRRFGTSYTELQDQKCRKKALERAEEYLQAIQTEISLLQDVNAKNKIKLIRWDDIQDNQYEAQIDIVERHYQTNAVLKEKIDAIAEGFIRLRLPQAKSIEQRLPFMVKYITQEMPILVTGHSWEGRHHSLLVYPTDGESKANVADNTVGSEDEDKPSMRNLIRDVKQSPLFEELRRELITAGGGYTGATGNITLPLVAPLQSENLNKSSVPTPDNNEVKVDISAKEDSFSMTKLQASARRFIRQSSRHA